MHLLLFTVSSPISVLNSQVFENLHSMNSSFFPFGVITHQESYYYNGAPMLLTVFKLWAWTHERKA